MARSPAITSSFLEQAAKAEHTLFRSGRDRQPLRPWLATYSSGRFDQSLGDPELASRCQPFAPRQPEPLVHPWRTCHRGHRSGVRLRHRWQCSGPAVAVYNRRGDRPLTRIYRYVLATDCGMAPNPQHGIVSLATCKPAIRSTARVGDWVVGVFPSPRNHLVAWAGKVAECVAIARYGVEFSNRRDSLCTPNDTGAPQRNRTRLPWYHTTEKDRQKDTRGSVLMFDPAATWYFGGQGQMIDVEVEHLVPHGQGHRINRVCAGDAERLEAWLRSIGPPGILACPRDPWPGPGRSPFDGTARKSRRC